KSTAFTAEKLSHVIDFMNLGGIGKDARRAVGHDGVRFPGIPKLIADLHVFFHSLIPSRSFSHLGAISIPFALGIGANDVPGHASAREMIKAGKPTDHRIRMLE